MVRRFFVSTFSSVLALTSASLYRADAAEAQNPPSQTGTRSIPEPDPIVVDPATVDRARSTLNAVAQGSFDRSQLAPNLDAFVPAEAFQKGASYVSTFGAPESLHAFEKRILADQTSTLFRVRYRKEILTWVFSVNDADQIVGLSLRRSPNNRIFNVVLRDVRY